MELCIIFIRRNLGNGKFNVFDPNKSLPQITLFLFILRSQCRGCYKTKNTVAITTAGGDPNQNITHEM